VSSVPNYLFEEKQVKLRWWQDPNEMNEYNLSYIRREANGHFMKNIKEYLKDKINGLE
jgi:hypothetical protein